MQVEARHSERCPVLQVEGSACCQLAHPRRTRDSGLHSPDAERRILDIPRSARQLMFHVAARCGLADGKPSLSAPSESSSW
jgi:hypothetical protein